MAISIVNITNLDSLSASDHLTVNIPATSVGNTLIIVCTPQNFSPTTVHITSCEDDEADTSKYIDVAGADNTLHGGGFESATNIFYRSNIPAGLTFVKANYSSSGASCEVSVMEVSGINYGTPVETSNTTHTTTSGSPHLGVAITTAYTNALFVSCWTQTASSSGDRPAVSPWTSMFDHSTRKRHMYLIASGTQTPGFTNGSTVEYIMSSAIFNPTPNAFTLSLSDGVTTNDSTPVNDDSIAKDDSISLSDFIDFILSTNTHFKSLFETLILADSIFTVWSALVTIQEACTLVDRISFIKDTFRIFNESIDIHDWLSVKKSSDDWGS